MKQIIKCNWNSEKSIKTAEKKKFSLENKGYTLIYEGAGLFTSTFIYELIK